MKTLRSLASEQGSTLAITMIMLLIATLIGVTAVNTSTTEVSMSGNYKSAKQTYYLTDSMMQYTLQWPSTFVMTSYAAPLQTQTVTDASLPTGNSVVTFLASGNPPPGFSAKTQGANYFTIRSTATGANNAQDTHVLFYAQVVPK